MKERCEYGLIFRCKENNAVFREDANKCLCPVHYKKYQRVHKFDNYHS